MNAEFSSFAPTERDTIRAPEANTPPRAWPDTTAVMYFSGNIPATPNRPPWKTAPAPVGDVAHDEEVPWQQCSQTQQQETKVHQPAPVTQGPQY
ncbi:hypothetical protein E2C01_011539 [Portunus trituberculatus]|uniref:Uncharacterized protein n=1 Tax=Portunus trituberculatus TaxID=210409 RepID=A0A5B7DBN5_PORTR|nr:hypothetical protein [Portunus trituberculatus]